MFFPVVCMWSHCRSLCVRLEVGTVLRLGIQASAQGAISWSWFPHQIRQSTYMQLTAPTSVPLD